MKYFIIGGTGSIGSALIPAATEAGHEVVGLARSDTAAQSLRSLGVFAIFLLRTLITVPVIALVAALIF